MYDTQVVNNRRGQQFGPISPRVLPIRNLNRQNPGVEVEKNWFWYFGILVLVLVFWYFGFGFGILVFWYFGINYLLVF
jgi:hypothetical protein